MPHIDISLVCAVAPCCWMQLLFSIYNVTQTFIMDTEDTLPVYPCTAAFVQWHPKQLQQTDGSRDLGYVCSESDNCSSTQAVLLCTFSACQATIRGTLGKWFVCDSWLSPATASLLWVPRVHGESGSSLLSCTSLRETLWLLLHTLRWEITMTTRMCSS